MTNNTFDCPDKHNEIVKNLLAGKFIIHSDELYAIVSENIIFYEEFFNKSYNYELVKNSEYIYLLSEAAKGEVFSRRFLLVLSVLAWEYNVKGKNLYDEIEKKHVIEEVKEVIKSSSYRNSCRGIELDKLFKDAYNRNIIKFIEDGVSFKFTSAVNMFLETARKIAELSH